MPSKSVVRRLRIQLKDRETWFPVARYEGLYEVSNTGEVRSLNWEGVKDRVQILKKTIRKAPRNKDGYYVVRLSKGNVCKSFAVGRLVLEAFDRPAIDKEEQNHLNGNSLDDNLNNLEWQTRSGNQKHAIRMGLAKPPKNRNPLGSGKKYWWGNDHRVEYETPASMARIVNVDSVPFFKMASGDTTYKSFHGWKILNPPPPGSDEALKLGCGCAVIDNHYGKGFHWGGQDNQYWINGDCPLHGNIKETKDES